MPRPRTFDEQDVVERAMEVFWTRGYEATSVTDLTAAVGVHPGSLYRAFGDKHGLLLAALDRYRAKSREGVAPALLAGGPVLPRIRAVLVGCIELAAEQQAPRGCLIANTAGEMLPGDKTIAASLNESLAVIEEGLMLGLQMAVRNGELADTLDLPATAAMLTMLMEGLQILVKVDPDPRRLVAAVETALLALASVR